MNGNRITRRSPLRDKRKVVHAFEEAREYPTSRKKQSPSDTSSVSSRLSVPPEITRRRATGTEISPNSNTNSTLVFLLETSPNDTQTELATMASGAAGMIPNPKYGPRNATSTGSTDGKPRRSSKTSNVSEGHNDLDTMNGISSLTTRRSSRHSTFTTTAADNPTTTSDAPRPRSRSRRSARVRLMTEAPSSPKEPMSAYDFYVEEELPKLKQENPKLARDQLDEKLQLQWKRNFDRNVYNNMEQEDLLRYEMELHQYNCILNAGQAIIVEEAKPPPGPTGLAPAASPAAVSISRLKLRTRGTQTKAVGISVLEVKDGDGKGAESSSNIPTKENFYKPCRLLKNKKRNQLLEQHRKLRRQKMNARRKGILANEEEDEEEEDEYRMAHSQTWQVEKIIGKRDCFQGHEFLIRWKGRDPSWDSWETIESVKELVLGQPPAYGNGGTGAGGGPLEAFWDEVRLFSEAEIARRQLMEEGAKEMGLDQWGEAFSKVEALVEIPLDKQKPIHHANNNPATSLPHPENTTYVASENVAMGLSPNSVGMETQPESEVICPSNPAENETEENISAQESKDTNDVTMMEMSTQPESETTTVSPLNHVQLDLYTKPEASFDEPTTVSTMTLGTGTTAESSNAMETDAQNPAAASAPDGGSSVSATAPETDTDTEMAIEATTDCSTEDTKPMEPNATPLQTLAAAAFGHGPEAASRESSHVLPPNSTSATPSSTPAATLMNERATEKAAVPMTIETKATAKSAADDVEVIVIDDGDDSENKTEREMDAVVAEVITTTEEPTIAADATGATANSSPATTAKAANSVEGKSKASTSDKSESQNGGSILIEPEQQGAIKESTEMQVTQQQQQEKAPTTDTLEMPQGSFTSDLPGKRTTIDRVHQKYRIRRRPLEDKSQYGNDKTSIFQVPSTQELIMREVRRVNAFDIDAKQIVTEARQQGQPIVLTSLLGYPQFATRWLKRWNGQNRAADDNEYFGDGDPHHHQHDELLDLSQPHELDIIRMIEDIGGESVPILKKNYSETKPIVKETFAANFLQKCWPRNGRQPPIKGLYLHQWQFPRSETAASKLCGHGNCTTLPNGIVGEDLLQFWLDGKDNPYQYIFMGEADTFSKLHKDNGGLDITIAPIVGEKECVMVHRLDESYLYGMKSKLDSADLDKYPMTAHARVWKTVVKPGELLWMPAGTFHQCRNVTPCLSYHRFHLDTINLKQFFESLFMGDAMEIEHDEVIWNCTIELIERVEKFLEDYHQQPTEPVPEHIAETAATLCYLRPLCREIAVAFDPSCNQIHLRPKHKLFRCKRAVNSRCWPQIVDDVDLTLHNFNHRNFSQVPEYQTQDKKPVSNLPVTEDPEAIQEGLARLQDSSSATKEYSATETNALQKLYDKLLGIQPFQEGVVISDSTQLKSNDKVIFRIGEKQCSGRIVKTEDELRTAYLTYSRFPSYFDEYRPVACIVSEQGSQLRKKQIVSSAIGGKGKPVMATVQSLKVATFYLVQFSMDARSAKLERWLCRDAIISKEN